MGKKEVLLSEIKEVPESLIDEVLDFVKFLKIKTIKQKIDIALLSESSLKKDWLREEEDEAWHGL